MDWIEILLLFVFFVLPLLQQLLGERKKPPPPRPVPPPREAADPEERAEARAREAALPAPAAEEGWSTGWGDWPSAEAEELERIAEAEVVDEEEALELTTRQEVLPDDAPEAVRVSAPVVSLEALEVDRAREHDRFHAGLASAPAARAAPDARLAALLRGRDDLRRAVLLAEVLGPPRGAR